MSSNIRCTSKSHLSHRARTCLGDLQNSCGRPTNDTRSDHGMSLLDHHIRPRCICFCADGKGHPGEVWFFGEEVCKCHHPCDVPWLQHDHLHGQTDPQSICHRLVQHCLIVRMSVALKAAHHTRPICHRLMWLCLIVSTRTCVAMIVAHHGVHARGYVQHPTLLMYHNVVDHEPSSKTHRT